MSFAFEEARTAWSRTQDELSHQIGREEHEVYVKPCQFFACEDGELTIHVPHAAAQSYLDTNHRFAIKQMLSQHLGQAVQVRFVVSGSVHPPRTDLPLTPLETLAQRQIEEPLPPERGTAITPPNLNQRYTFENLVVGGHNQLAHAAAQALANHPNSPFTSLFIYADVGLGKTHLLHAVGHEARRRQAHVVNCTTEQFTNDLVTSIRTKTMDDFRRRYRAADLLLLDDVQFLSGKERTQEEFFYTFTELFERGKQVVLTSDSPPKQISNLERRLCSRFEGGMLVDINKPEFETRLAILQTKVEMFQYDIPTHLLHTIAQHVESNVRELEGVLHHLNLLQIQSGGRSTEAQVMEYLGNLTAVQDALEPEDLVATVEGYFGLEPRTLAGKSRKKAIAHARQVAMYLLRIECKMSQPMIGRLLGGRDHTTVGYGADKISADLPHDNKLAHEVNEIRHLLQTGTRTAVAS